ncbi:ComF family protein [Methylacidimicrobium sp. AP8]|uniref:ComF family protein n=1 Tax=Methylacidimicrobium sp. AP8 TaxID=2730359 RepID=UPI0018C0E9EC|nr:ComF family protein [Methylacidimicrobium sp. AP8]CAB4242865.1 ComF family protein [Methylacidimicrobium sp. AP8]
MDRLWTAAAWTGRLAEDLLDLVFPPRSEEGPVPEQLPPFCRRCAAPGVVLCARCRESPPDFLWARAACRYGGAVQEAILGLKYRKQIDRLPWLSDLLEIGFRTYAATLPWDALVPVPLHPVRERSRGFNQAEELARLLGKRQGIPVRNALRRVRPTPPQAGLPSPRREHNLSGAFQPKRNFDPAGKNLLLIDDVITTGATVRESAARLRENGARTVCVLAVARS